MYNKPASRRAAGVEKEVGVATKTKLAKSNEEITAIMAEAEKAGQRLHRDFAQLMEEHPNQWVAASKDGLVAHHDELEGLIALYEAAGYNGNQVAVEYMDPDPFPQIL